MARELPKFDGAYVQQFLPLGKECQVFDGERESVTVRTTFPSEEEANEFINAYGLKSDTQYTSRGNNETKLFSKTYFFLRVSILFP